jgi:micrococcal nuclease
MVEFIHKTKTSETEVKMYIYRCKINKVVDGDTVEIDLDLGFNIILANQKVRMAGIDTPESRTANEEEKKRGMISKKKLAEKLPVGSWQKIQTMKSDSNDDKFGRILGVFIMEDGLSLNQWLIDNNYAVLYQGENKELVQEMHQYNKQKLIERGELK